MFPPSRQVYFVDCVIDILSSVAEGMGAVRLSMLAADKHKLAEADGRARFPDYTIHRILPAV